MVLFTSRVGDATDRQKIHWNVSKLRRLRNKKIPKHKLSVDELLELWDRCIAPHVLRSFAADNFRDYISHLYFPEIKYYNWRMSSRYIEITKDLVEAIVVILADPNAHDLELINSNVNAISDGIKSCPDRQMGELRLSYFILQNEFDPDDTLDTFVEKFIAREKERVFDCVATPINNSQNVHSLNHWKFKLREELGFEMEFRSQYGVVGDDRFCGSCKKMLAEFYRVFTPERVITTLTEEINHNKPQLCLALQMISRMAVENRLRAELFFGGESDVMFAEGITQKFLELYLIERELVELEITKGCCLC